MTLESKRPRIAHHAFCERCFCAECLHGVYEVVALADAPLEDGELHCPCGGDLVAVPAWSRVCPTCESLGAKAVPNVVQVTAEHEAMMSKIRRVIRRLAA